MSARALQAQLEKDVASALSQLATQLDQLRGPASVRPAPTASAAKSAVDIRGAVASALQSARREAAVLGWFDPATLVETSDPGVREQVLSALVAESDIEARGDRRLWSLRRDPRREELAALAKKPANRDRVLRDTRGKLGKEDVEARLLRRVLKGESLAPERLRTAEASQVLQVAEWTRGILAHAPDPMELRCLIARREMVESLAVLLRDGFRGREEELKALRRFVSAPPAAKAIVPVYALSGIGGVGKSTLLARFADRLLAQRDDKRPALVLLDFDRARFAWGDPLALTFELTRQVAAWFPALAAPLQQLRHSIRDSLQSGASGTKSTLENVGTESARSALGDLIYQLGPVLATAGIGTSDGKPLVILLDTFEVLQGGRGADADAGLRGPGAVADWIQDLSSSLSQLRIIACGRAPIAEEPAFVHLLRAEDELRLRGLDRVSAESLLQDLGLPPAAAETVVQVVTDPADDTCNPLVLRLVARLVSSGTVTLEALRSELRGGQGAVDQELVQGILYQRILRHIGQGGEGDPALKELAHPGLVLRRVTPTLIEKVLAPVLRLPGLDAARARELFDKLRSEVWLVQDVGSDTVVHRPDLRRTMMRLITAASGDVAAAIHRQAIAHYEQGLEPGVPSEVAAGEVFYHRLMLMDEAAAARIEPKEVVRFETALHSTLGDLPRPVLAIVKSALDRPLRDEEGLALPEPRRTEFILRNGERHVSADEPNRALALLAGRPDLHPLWQLKAFNVTAAWGEAKDAGLLKDLETRQALTPREDLERATLVAFIQLSLGDRRAVRAAAAPLVSRFQGEEASRIPAHAVEHFARALTLSALAGVSFSTRIEWDQLPSDYFHSAEISLEATRHGLLGLTRSGSFGLVVVNGSVVPPSPRQLERMAKSNVDMPKDLRRTLGALRKELKGLPRDAPSGLVLGTIARRFTGAPFVVPLGKPAPRASAWAPLCTNPEFRGPAKYALMDAFDGSRDLRTLAELAWPLLDLRAGDLKPDVFAATACRPARKGIEITSLVQYLDRSGVLNPLLQRAREEKPGAEKLKQVAGAFDRWSRAFREASSSPRPGSTPR